MVDAIGLESNVRLETNRKKYSKRLPKRVFFSSSFPKTIQITFNFNETMDDTGWQVKTLSTKFVLKYKICTKMYYKYMLLEQESVDSLKDIDGFCECFMSGSFSLLNPSQSQLN